MSDLISRQDAIYALEEHLDYLRMLDKNDNPTAESKWYGVNWARNTIADLPSAEERPQGEWLHDGINVEGMDLYRCSICNRTIVTWSSRLNEYPYCHCGASMQGKGEECI